MAVSESVVHVPCKKDCGYREYEDVKKVVKTVCLLCKNPIGYGTLYVEYEERLFHTSCLK